MLRCRASGVLLHISSLPSPYGIGDLGPEADRFVGFLKRARQSFWQILPLNYTNRTTGFSPYNCFSAFAGNPLLISPDRLYEQGWIGREDLRQAVVGPADHVDFTRVSATKGQLLDRAFQRFQRGAQPDAFETFVRYHQAWLQDFTLFVSLKRHLRSRAWNQWPRALRDREAKALDRARTDLRIEVLRQQFYQFLFWQQYTALRATCHEQGVQIIGDIPIYVAYDSTDVWAHPNLFKLTVDKRPRFKAGVPPDYFSRTGQLWGNPVYDWACMGRDRYAWFIDRVAHNLDLFDVVRIDHFRGLAAYWEVPAGHRTAIRGQWIQGPGRDLFAALFHRLPFARIFAEDLGYITPDVRELMREFRFPGMKVLQFGLDGDPSRNCHTPHNHPKEALVYPGTHDNNTARGWFENDATPAQKRRLRDTLGHRPTVRTVAWDLIRLAEQSVAQLAVIPMQDLLDLGGEARMNHPAKTRGNWRWRMRPGAVTSRIANRLAQLTELCGRAL